MQKSAPPRKKCAASLANSLSLDFHDFEPSTSKIDIIFYKINKKPNKYHRTSNLLHAKVR